MAISYTMPEVGDVIADRYRIEQEIGHGGFGVVFRATQIGMQREVAVKTLLPSAMAQEEMVERFRREAVLARNLNHPNTIRLYDFGTTDGGIMFIAMEFLVGFPLDEVIKKEGPLQAGRVQRIAGQVLKSLAEAHQHEIIHRDLKPANIFVVDMVGEEDFVKVLDFGIAKAFGQEAGSGKLTQTGIGFGTPKYMAPEQVRGKNICPATDMYALGLLMTECLTGEAVYSGESTMDVAVQQLSESPPPIPEWVLRGPLGPVIQRATQKDIRLRYPSAAEMLRDLKTVDPRASINISTKLDTRELDQMGDAADDDPEESGGRLPLYIGLGVAILFFILAIGVAGVIAILALNKDGTPEASAKAIATSTKRGDDGRDRGADDSEEDDEVLAGDPKTEESAPDAGPAMITASVTTSPEGASLYDGEEYLGTSPVKIPFPKGDGKRSLSVQMAGFRQVSLDIDLDKDSNYQVTLEVEIDTTKPIEVSKPVRDRPTKTEPRPVKDAKKPPVKEPETDKPKPDNKVLIPKL